MTVSSQLGFRPEWFYKLEESECAYRAAHCFKMRFGNLYLSPQYPYWAAGNTFYVCMQDKANLDASEEDLMGCIQEVERLFESKCPEVSRSFLMTRAVDPASDKGDISIQVAERWQRLLEQRGFVAEMDLDSPSHLMAVSKDTLVMPNESINSDGRYIKIAAGPADLEDVLATEPGPVDAKWRLLKCEELVSRPHRDTLTYTCYTAEHEPVARVLVVFNHEEDGPLANVAFVARVNTRPEFRRKGYALSAISHAYHDVFERGWADVIALLADEEGPIALYRKVGMSTVGIADEIEMIKKQEAC